MRRTQTGVVVDAVKHERAHDEVEPRGGERDLLDRALLVGHTGMGVRRSRQHQHPLRHVHADHLGGAARREMVRQLPGSTAEVQHSPPLDVGKEREQVGMLHGPRPAGSEPFERRIPGEKVGVVIDVLRIHGASHPPILTRPSCQERVGHGQGGVNPRRLAWAPRRLPRRPRPTPRSA